MLISLNFIVSLWSKEAIPRSRLIIFVENQKPITMKKKLVFFLLFTVTLTSSISFGQQKNTVEDNYLEYFKLPRESLFLHTNKTTFLPGENIWFKAYAYDRKNNLSSKATTNIYLGIYDASGNQLDKKLYLAKEGAAVGNFAIDSTYASGDYFLKISTNWMKNFKEDDSYIQKIKIINPQLKGKEIKKTNDKEYDFQFLPEGGHILYGVKNTIGIKAINDSGKGTSSIGSILNSKNEEVASFKSNFLGIGKFSFIPLKGESYKAKITLDNGKKFEKSIEGIKENGIAISVNNINSDKTIITLSTNEESFNKIKNKSYKLLLHKDGKVKSIPVTFNSNKELIAIAVEDLFRGVNTVTLFDDGNRPLLERMFFNNSIIKDFNLSITKTGSDIDSLIYQITSNNFNNGEILNMSISVLPSETKSYNQDHTIVSAFYLKPYLKGTIENPQYYFSNISRKKKFELDVLLLTQGWSRYSWNNIFISQPKPSFDFENGIAVNGFINKKVEKISSLLLYPTKQNKSTFINIDNEGKFNLKNFYPEVNEEIRFSYYGKKGKMKRPNMNLSFIKFMDIDEVKVSDYKSFLSFYNDKNEIPEQFFIDDSYEELDEIRIKTDLRKKLSKELRDPILVNGRITKITEEDVNRYPNITDFIVNNGFDVLLGDGVITPLGQVLIQSRSRPAGATPTVFLDGIIIRDFSVLLNLSTERIEKVVIDRTGIGLGLSGGFGGAIKIYRRKGVFTKSGSVSYNDTYYGKISDYGFEPVKEFYTPAYASYRSQTFKDYGVIHLEPSLNVSKNNSGNIKTFDTGLDEINFYIEAINSDGSVFSQVIKVEGK